MKRAKLGVSGNMNRVLPRGGRAQRVQVQQQHGSGRREGSRLAAALSLGVLVICCNSNTAVNAFVSPATSAVSAGMAVRHHKQHQLPQQQRDQEHRTGFQGAAGSPAMSSGPRRRRRRVSVACASMGSSSSEDEASSAAVATKEAFNDVLEKGNTEECLELISVSGSKLDLGMTEASKLLNMMSGEIERDLKEDNAKDLALTKTYNILKAAGLLPGFGSIDFAKVPSKARDVSAEKLLSLSGVEKQNLAPGRPTGSWLSAGVGVFGAEYLAGRLLGLDPLQTIIPWTLGLIFADRILLNGAVAESLTRLIVPGYRERIIRHEAGHFLVAYLLGCPVQGCLLDPFALAPGLSGAQGGTVFADPILTKQMSQGKLTKSAIDRFTIVLMGGIAAEAINYGNSEGGAADEGVMIGILSTIAPPFDREQIKSQALWAATQAVLLIQEHKEAYEVLVGALERGEELGECVRVIETELAKRELPGDVRRANRQPPSPADGMRSMLVRRMSKRSRSEQDRMLKEALRQNARDAPAAETTAAATTTTKLEQKLAEKDTAMIDLQRRVEDLERALESGTSVGAQGLKKDSGGVWMNDLKALREDITATNEKNKMAAAALDAVLSDDPTTTVEVPSPTLSTAASATATAEAPAPQASSAPPAATVTAAASSEASPGDTKRAKILKDIDEKTADNAKRMAEVEARLKRFEEKQEQR